MNAIYLCHKYNGFPGFSYRNNDGYLCYFTRHNEIFFHKYLQIISDTGVIMDIIGRIDRIYGIYTDLTSTKFNLGKTNKNKMAKVQLVIRNRDDIIECYVIVGFSNLSDTSWLQSVFSEDKAWIGIDVWRVKQLVFGRCLQIWTLQIFCFMCMLWWFSRVLQFPPPTKLTVTI